MAKFEIGDHVRLKVAQDDDEPWLCMAGRAGIIVGTGRAFMEDYAASYDWVVDVENHGDYCAYEWQLEPLIESSSWEEIEKLMPSIRELFA